MNSDSLNHNNDQCLGSTMAPSAATRCATESKTDTVEIVKIFNRDSASNHVPKKVMKQYTSLVWESIQLDLDSYFPDDEDVFVTVENLKQYSRRLARVFAQEDLHSSLYEDPQEAIDDLTNFLWGGYCFAAGSFPGCSFCDHSEHANYKEDLPVGGCGNIRLYLLHYPNTLACLFGWRTYIHTSAGEFGSTATDAISWCEDMSGHESKYPPEWYILVRESIRRADACHWNEYARFFTRRRKIRNQSRVADDYNRAQYSTYHRLWRQRYSHLSFVAYLDSCNLEAEVRQDFTQIYNGRPEAGHPAGYKPQARYTGVRDQEAVDRKTDFWFVTFINLICMMTLAGLLANWLWISMKPGALDDFRSAVNQTWGSTGVYLHEPLIQISRASAYALNSTENAFSHLDTDVIFLSISLLNMLICVVITLGTTWWMARFFHRRLNQLWLGMSSISTSEVEDFEDLMESQRRKDDALTAAAEILRLQGDTRLAERVRPERRVAKSPVYEKTMLPFMVEFGYMVDNLFRPTGMGSRMKAKRKSFVVTASHVYRACGSEPVIRSSSGRQYKLTQKPDFECKKLDVVQWDLPDTVASALGLSSINMAVPRCGAINIVGRMSGSTFGQSYGCLVDSSDALELVYDASTFDGWSGSPIVQKGKAIGIHLGTAIAERGELNAGVTFSVFHVARSEFISTPHSNRNHRLDWLDEEDFAVVNARRRGNYRGVHYAAGRETVFATNGHYDGSYEDDQYEPVSQLESFHSELNQFVFKNEPLCENITQIATSANYTVSRDLKEKTEWTEKIAEQFPEINDFEWPQRGPESERKSMVAHAKRHVHADTPSESLLESAMATYKEAYAAGRIEFYNSKLKRELFDREFQRLVCAPDFVGTALNLKSIPGYPYANIAVTNRDLLTNHYGWFKELVLNRMMKLIKLRNGIPEDPREWLQGDLPICDPARQFVKQEAHALTKLEIDRFRLVVAQSAADQMVQRLLFERLDKSEIQSFPRSPSAPGIGFSDELTAAFMNEVQSNIGPEDRLLSNDVISWDWQVPEWLIGIEGDIRVWKLGMNPSSNAAKLVKNVLDIQKRCPRATSDGKIYLVNFPGIWISGQRITGSGNSSMRVFAAHLVAVMLGYKPWAKAMGDDCLERVPKTISDKAVKEAYAKLGLPLKEIVEQNPNKFEFCSHIFENGVAYPARLGKILFHVANKSSRTIETAVQFEYLLRHHPNQKAVMDHLARIGWDARKDRKEINLQHRSMSKAHAQQTKQVNSLRNQVADLKRELEKVKKSNPSNQVGPMPRPFKNMPKPELKDVGVTKAKSLAKTAAAKVACEKALDYAKLVDNPFSANFRHKDGSYVTAPITNGEMPCRSSVVRNYGAADITTTLSAGQVVQVRLTPEGYWDEQNNVYVGNLLTLIDPDTAPSTANFFNGPRPTNTGEECIFGSYAAATGASMWAATSAAGYTALKWDQINEPALFTKANYMNSQQYRLIAFGVRVTVTGDLQEVDGFVECFQSYDLTPSATSTTQVRQNGQYKIRYFGDKRSHSFNYVPNCDSVNYVSNLAAASVATNSPATRMVLNISVESATPLRLEAIGFYELVFPAKLSSSMVPRSISSHSAQLKTAILHSFGSPDGVHHKLLEKVAEQHPVLRKVWHLAKDGLAAVGGYESLMLMLGL